jgi:hypothetical protein
MFESNMVEGLTRTVVVEDISFPVMLILMKHIYTGCLDTLQAGMGIELIREVIYAVDKVRLIDNHALL